MWRRVLVMLLVPVIWLGNGVAADAATAATAAAAGSGTWIGTTFRFNGGGYGYPNFDCWLSSRHDPDGDTLEVRNGDCVGGFDLSPGFSQPGEAGSTYKVGVQGDLCNEWGAGGTLQNHARNATTTTAGTMADHSFTVGVGCVPVQLCLYVEGDEPGTNTWHEECIDVIWPDATTAGCEYGTPVAYSLHEEPYSDPSYHFHWSDLTVKDRTTGTWRMSFIRPTDYTYDSSHSTDVGTWTDAENWTYHPTSIAGNLQGGSATNPAVPTHYQGVQVWHASIGGAPFSGTTVPENCSFFFGVKFRDDGVAGAGADEPWSGVGEDPIPYDEPPTSPLDDVVGGSPDNEVDWLGWLADLIRQLLSLVAGIAGAILDGLKALMLPSPGFLEDKLGEVRDAWANSAPLAFLGGIGDLGNALTIAEPSGCQGPVLNITDPITDSAHTLYRLSACGDAVAQVASLVKIALTAVVYVGAFLVAVRIIGAAFGLDLSIGKGGDE